MTEIFNKKSQLDLRRKLRRQPILSENELWSRLRARRSKYKFRRQFGIGRYIVDFYCPRLKLVIEIDGATHSSDDEIRYDNERQKYLESLGLTVKRYTNNDIKYNLPEVLEDIFEKCNELNGGCDI